MSVTTVEASSMNWRHIRPKLEAALEEAVPDDKGVSRALVPARTRNTSALDARIRSLHPCNGMKGVRLHPVLFADL